MKKTTMTLAAAALALCSAATHAATPANNVSGTPNSAADFVLSTSYSVESGTATVHSTFTNTLSTNSDAVRPIGYFTLTGVDGTYNYKLGNVTAIGADSDHVVSTGCFTSGVPSGGVCTDTNGVKDVVGTDTLYVQVDHAASAAAPGTTFVNVPVTAFAK